MKYESIFDLIGNTPLIRSEYLSNKYGSNVYLKLEKYNLTNSCKDRAVKEMIFKAINEKNIDKNTTVIEATSGNTGISIAAICAYLNLKCIIVMPENSNVERINLIRFYNGKVVFTPSKDKMLGSIKKAKQINKKIKNSFLISQFKNIGNINANMKTNALEIINDLPDIDTFICSSGTSGSVMGTSIALKEYNDKIKTVLVKPSCKNHIITGVFSNIKPFFYEKKLIDEIITVDDVTSIKTLKLIGKKQGIGLGLSSGLAIAGAIKYLRKNKGRNVVIYCSDGIERYLSNKYVFADKIDVFVELDLLKKSLFSSFDYDLFFKYKLTYTDYKHLKRKLILDARFIYENDPSCLSIKQVINSYHTFYAIVAYRIANLIYYKGYKNIARMISEYAYSKTSIDIHPGCKIGYNFSIDHGCNVVIGQTCKIGNNVRIYQNVTLGAKSLSKINNLRNRKRHPTIKNNVIIYAGATILGGNTIIGNNVIIGSNTFITSSVKDNMIVLCDNKNILKENKHDI